MTEPLTSMATDVILREAVFQYLSTQKVSIWGQAFSLWGTKGSQRAEDWLVEVMADVMEIMATQQQERADRNRDPEDDRS